MKIPRRYNYTVHIALTHLMTLFAIIIQTLPLWALPDSLNMMMKNQEEDLKCNRVNIAEIFPPEQLLRDPDLARIFRNKRQRFYQRSSSAQWNSPMIKKSRIV